MKIASIDIIRVTLGEPSNIGSPWNPVVLRINTDEGISGYGEMGLTYGHAKEAASGMAQDFACLIIGMDPRNTEQIWEKLFRQTFWGQGGGGVVFSAISAIDIALWDLKGKALGVPVYQLLGGLTNKRVRAYASQIQFDWGGYCRHLIEPVEYAEATHKAIADGYNCVKVDPIGYDKHGNWKQLKTTGLMGREHMRLAVDRVAAIREAGGPDLDIIIELHALTDAVSAVQFAREVEQYGIFYYEEPTTPLNAGNMSYVAQRTNIPIASGERIYGRYSYAKFFEERSLQVIQPDLGNTGGISEGKKICDMAHAYDIGVQIHVCGGPLATATALQLEGVIPNFLIHEHHSAALLGKNIASCKYNYQPVDGYFEVPDRPGIGNELSEEAIKTAMITTIRE